MLSMKTQKAVEPGTLPDTRILKGTKWVLFPAPSSVLLGSSLTVMSFIFAFLLLLLLIPSV